MTERPAIALPEHDKECGLSRIIVAADGSPLWACVGGCPIADLGRALSMALSRCKACGRPMGVHTQNDAYACLSRLARLGDGA